MSEKKYEELHKLYDNNKIGALVQEICEYYSTRDNYEDNSYEDEIEPPEIVEAAYELFCLQSREQILDEFDIVRKKYPTLYQDIAALHNTLLINMDFSALEKRSAGKIAARCGKSPDEILSKVDLFSRSSNNLSEALDCFFKWL